MPNPFQLLETRYHRELAVQYADYWAYRRNPQFDAFDELGGDCTNFVSQAIYYANGVMNFTPDYGWYYLDINHRAPAWTGVIYLYQFLTRNQEAGPFAREVSPREVMPGDICQLVIDQENFHHSPVIVSVGRPGNLDEILVAAHTYPADNKPLSGYDFQKVRFLHIEGFRRWE